MAILTQEKIDEKKITKHGNSFKIGEHYYKPQSPEIVEEIIKKLNNLINEFYLLRNKLK